MNTPIPTPFDIIDPSPGAVIPTALAWCALAVLTAVVLSAIALYRRTPHPQSLHRTLHTLLDELRHACMQPREHRDLPGIARLVRRITSAYCGTELGAMSCRELRAMAQRTSRQSEESARSLGSILGVLADLEEQMYAPHDTIHPLNVTGAQPHGDPLTTLVQALETHVRRYQPL